MIVGPLVASEDVAWFRDAPEAARGAATVLARRIGLGDERATEVAVAVAELASNVRKHAHDGAILLRVVRALGAAGVEVLVTDGGPGIADVGAAMRDGTSATGTLGVGLGAVARLADVFQIHSYPGRATVRLARFWPRNTPEEMRGREPALAGITRPISGEEVCGDAWCARMDPPGACAAPPAAVCAADSAVASDTFRPIALRDAAPGPGPGVLVMLCDGLGHGPLASLAARASVRAFGTGTARLPDQVMREIHLALRGTRGAVITVARIEPDAGRILFCGVGNICAYILDEGKRSTLPSHPGIVGHHMQHLYTYEHPLPRHGVLVMHSDGLSARWNPTDLPGLLNLSPTMIAAHLLRHAGIHRDDAGIVVVKGMW